MDGKQYGQKEQGMSDYNPRLNVSIGTDMWTLLTSRSSFRPIVFDGMLITDAIALLLRLPSPIPEKPAESVPEPRSAEEEYVVGSAPRAGKRCCFVSVATMNREGECDDTTRVLLLATGLF